MLPQVVEALDPSVATDDHAAELVGLLQEPHFRVKNEGLNKNIYSMTFNINLSLRHGMFSSNIDI